jgi:hypothetical protein
MMSLMWTKTCIRCGETKDASLFPGDRNRADGYYPRCKACNSAAAKIYYRAKKLKPNVPLGILTDKRCNSCGKRKPFSEFSPHPQGSQGLQSFCKPCLCREAKACQRRKRDQQSKATGHSL